MRATTKLAYFAITSLLASLPFVSCTSTEQLPQLDDGDIASLSFMDYKLSLEKNSGEVTAELDDSIPSNVHVEISTDQGQLWTGDFAAGTLIVLPEGATVMTASDTSAPVSGGLTLYSQPPPMPPGPFSPQQGGSVAIPTQPILVHLFSVDQFEPTDDWDVQGLFTVQATNERQAHRVVQEWAYTRGLDFEVNGRIQEVHGAWTQQFVDNQGTYEFHVTCLNDQKSQVSGSFNYEDGSSVALTWSPMQKRNTPLWMSTSVVDLGLFPADSTSILESFRIDAQAQNSTDGVSKASFEVQVKGTQVP